MCMQHIQELHFNPELMCAAVGIKRSSLWCLRPGAIMSREFKCRRVSELCSHRVIFVRNREEGPRTLNQPEKPQRAIMIVIYIDTLQHKSYETCFRCHCEDLYQRDATRNQAPESDST